MVLEVSDVHASLEEVFVRLTSPSRADAMEDLGKELDAKREAEQSAANAEAEPEGSAEADADGKEDA
jgi:hypothetical protein